MGLELNFMPKTWRSVKPLFSNIDKFVVFLIARRFGHLKPRCGERFHTLQSQDGRNAIKANGAKFGNRLGEISIRSLTNICHGSFLLNRVIILNVSVPSTQLFVLCRVQIPDLISVHEQPCNAVLNKHKHQGNESKQTNPTNLVCKSLIKTAHLYYKYFLNIERIHIDN